MSRKNKVNPDHYKIAGRLTPDEIARERVKQTSARNRPAARENAIPQPVKRAAATKKKVR
jgi:hypothetical protein